MALSDNWRFTTSRYISGLDGSDSDTGGQGDPYQTLGKYITNVTSGNVTGSIRNAGVYNEGGFDITVAGIYQNKGLRLFGDGFVVIDGSGFFPFFRGNRLSGFGFFAENITFININELKCDGFGDPRSTKYTKCRFYDSIGIDLNLESRNNLFVRCGIRQIESVVTTYFRNTFIDSSISIISDVAPVINADGHTFLNCAFDDGSSINNNGGSITYNITNCAFEDDNAGSGFQIDGVDITAITLDGDGAAIGTLYADGEKFSGALTVGTETITFTNCFWTASMGFNEPSKDVFTLSNSPQSILLNGNNVIGALGLALFIDSGNQCFDPLNSGVSISPNITRNLGTGNFDITVSPGGIVRSTDDPTKAIVLPFSTSISDFIEWSLQGFNFFNGEWVDDDNYNDPANLEVRLTYKVSVYDEVGLAWSPFFQYELNQPLQKDGSGRGNGNVDATMTALGDVIGRIFRIEFFLRDNG